MVVYLILLALYFFAPTPLGCWENGLLLLSFIVDVWCLCSFLTYTVKCEIFSRMWSFPALIFEPDRRWAISRFTWKYINVLHSQKRTRCSIYQNEINVVFLSWISLALVCMNGMDQWNHQFEQVYSFFNNATQNWNTRVSTLNICCTTEESVYSETPRLK